MVHMTDPNSVILLEVTGQMSIVINSITIILVIRPIEMFKQFYPVIV